MRKMNFLAVLVTALLFVFNLSAQTIVNGGFEQATSNGHPNNATNWDRGCSQFYSTQSGWYQGTSDLYTTAAGSMPAQNRVNPRTANNYNFAGMLGPKMGTVNGQPTLIRGESVINKVNGTFVANRQYTISFYAARAYFGNVGQNTNVKAEAVLRVDGNCTLEKVIPININIPIQNFGEGPNATNNWTYLTATFTLTAAEAANQFNAIELRHKYEGFDINFPDFLFVDDLAMSYVDLSTADVEPVNPISYSTEPSYYGNIEIAHFCEGEIFVDGSGSANETNYYITVKEWDLMSWTPVAGGQSFTSQTFNGQVPANIDLEAAIGASLNTGAFYQVSIIVGPNWNADWLYISVDECCPDELELEVDCARGEISVIDLPAGSTVTSTTWSYKKKILGTGTVFLTGNTNYSTVTASQGNGYYLVTMTIILADGTECTVSGMVHYSEEACCQISYPNGLEAWVSANNNVIGYQSVAACGTTFNVPIICNASREYSFDISLCPNIDGYSIYNSHFNASNCTDITTLYSTAGSGTIPSTLTLNSNQYELGELNHLVIYATDPGLNPTFQEVHILYIPHNGDLCSGQLGKSLISTDETSAEGVVEISTIHPNPANDFTTVSLNQSTSGTVRILAMDGRVLTSVSFDDQREVSLSTMELPNGMYIVELKANNQTITKKLIKE